MVSVGDRVIINRAYVVRILSGLDFSNKQQTLASLGHIGENPAEVIRLGVVSAGGQNLRFVCLLPLDQNSLVYREGRGVCVYFPSTQVRDDSFELASAIINDKCFISVYNGTISAISKGEIVRQDGFDTTRQIATVDLASAISASTTNVLGVATADIASGETGAVLVEGAFCGFDTSGFSLQDTVFLSDTSGQIATVAGTNATVLGRVTNVDASDGCIFITPSFGGGGGSGGFFTDGTGTNAAIGKGATAPTASGVNSLAQGDGSSVGGDNSFAFGYNVSVSGNNSFGQGSSLTLGSGAGNFAQGTGHTVPDTSTYCIQFGDNNTINASNNQIFQWGESHFVNTGNQYCAQFGDSSFMGQNNTHCFQFAERSDMSDNNTYIFQFGRIPNVADGNEHVFQFGEGLFTNDNNTYIAQFGSDCSNGSNNNHIFAVGERPGVSDNCNYFFGFGNRAYGGDYVNFGVSFGYRSNIRDNTSHAFTFGERPIVNENCNHAVVFGYYGAIPSSRSNQFVLSSNRAGPAGGFGTPNTGRGRGGGAQNSKIIKYLQTTDDTTTPVITLVLEGDKAYSIQHNIVGRRSDTTGNNVSFVLNQSLITSEGAVQVNGSSASGLTFDGTAETVTRGSGSFITDGYVTGMTLIVSGTSLNDGRFAISGVTASTITVSGDFEDETTGSSADFLQGIGPATIVGSPTFTQVSEGTGSSTSASLGTSEIDLLINVTGVVGETWEWCAEIDFMEVAGQVGN